MLLSDAMTDPEAWKSLLQNWPILAVMFSGMAWFARYVAQPLTSRHIAWMDAMEERDKLRIASSIEHQNTLNTVHEKVSAIDGKTTVIKELVSRHVPPMQPHGGA